ncbi:hypothetical protein [Nocardia altamirensis]|uniref:hypothetical protein n=1 Tax=Nocardia altamirensis TaxID=472158 RepID=UPI00084039AC|nr:hypothetical protein [Nocardia altamirensis]
MSTTPIPAPFSGASASVTTLATVSTISAETLPPKTAARPACEGMSDDWDLDVGTPIRWKVAVRICHSCPLLSQCQEFAQTLIARGDAPRALIWAGVGYDNSGRVVDDLDRYRPLPIDRNRPLRIIRNGARPIRSEPAPVAPHRHLILGRPLEPTGTGDL